MNEVSSLVTSLTSLCGTFLGASYSELKQKHNIELNAFKGSNNKYGVISRDISETTGATCFITVDQTFEINLTNSYSTVNNNDSSKDNAIIALQDISLELYNEIIKTKANNPSIVMVINSLSSTIEELEEDKVIINKLSFNIKYRKAL
jgi:hypothetical protein